MFVIIGDIVSSRKINNRFEIQEKLNKCFDKINKDYQDSFVSKISITLGDEFQGILSKSKDLFNIINRIEREMDTINIRFSIGVGNITTRIPNDTPLGSDGPVWWSARDSIEYIKEKNKRGVYGKTNIIISGNIKEEILELINNSLVLCYRIKNNWTKKQKEIFNYVFKKHGVTDNFIQAEIASIFGIAESDINRKIKTSGFMDFVKTINSIGNIIKLYGEENV